MSLIKYITHIQFDFGAISLLKSECQRINMAKPLIVSDPGVKAAGILQKILVQLNGMPIVVFDQTPSNPTESAVMAAAEFYQKNNCDGIIAVGGGSVIDCAKGVALAATHTRCEIGSLKTYATIEGGSDRITDLAAPLIAIPTTSGTGSEVARGALLIVADGRKLGFHSWHLVPKVAICDPELTLGLPTLMTAATGMDAVAHCMETFMAPSFNPPADSIALDGLSRAWQYIERATKNGSDREARLQMMSASMQGAMAFQKGLGCVHSLSHSLGSINPKLHHGTLNAVFLPAVVSFNARAESIKREDKLNKMAYAMGLGLAAGASIAPAIYEMNEKLGLPKGLSTLGVSENEFDRLIAGAQADHCHKTNPIIASAIQYNELIRESM